MALRGARALTVGQVLDLVKASFGRTLASLCVGGEVVDPLLSRSGHFYFSLRDPQGMLRVVMYRGDAERQSSLPKAGENVMLRGGLTVFAPRGDMQFRALSLARVGHGDKMAELAQLKERLRAEGLFDRARRPLPFLPRRLGLVTSLGSAVLHDMAQCVRRRNPAVELWLAPAQVSGEQSSTEVRRGLRWLEGKVDVVIIARGGGSFEELLPFSDEALVRAVVAYPVPVISAIGHGSDLTLLDLVADAHAATPTAGAELATPRRDQLLSEHVKLRRRIQSLQDALLLEKRRELWALTRFCRSQSPLIRLGLKRVSIEQMTVSLVRGLGIKLQFFNAETAALRSRLQAHRWDLRLDGLRQDYAAWSLRLKQAMDKQIILLKKELYSYQKSCRELGPHAVLARGYALARAQGRLVTTIEGRRVGEELELVLADGKLVVTVAEITGS